MQPDNLFGPCKVANLGGIAGTLDQDRLAAIRARLGAGPVPIPVTSTVSMGSRMRGNRSAARAGCRPRYASRFSLTI